MVKLSDGQMVKLSDGQRVRFLAGAGNDIKSVGVSDCQHLKTKGLKI